MFVNFHHSNIPQKNLRFININRKNTWKIHIFFNHCWSSYIYWKVFSSSISNLWFRTICFDPKVNLETIVSPLKFLNSWKITPWLMITYWLIRLYNMYPFVSSQLPMKMHLTPLESNFVLVSFGTWANVAQPKTCKWFMEVLYPHQTFFSVML